MPLWLTPIVLVPLVYVIASPAFTGAFAIVATLGVDELQCELMLTSCVEPSLNVPVATYCCVAPALTEALTGVIATDTSVPLPIVTVVLPLRPENDAVRVSLPAFFARRIPLPPCMLARLFFDDRHDTPVSVAVLPSL